MHRLLAVVCMAAAIDAPHARPTKYPRGRQCRIMSRLVGNGMQNCQNEIDCAAKSEADHVPQYRMATRTAGPTAVSSATDGQVAPSPTSQSGTANGTTAGFGERVKEADRVLCPYHYSL